MKKEEPKKEEAKKPPEDAKKRPELLQRKASDGSTTKVRSYLPNNLLSIVCLSVCLLNPAIQLVPGSPKLHQNSSFLKSALKTEGQASPKKRAVVRLSEDDTRGIAQQQDDHSEASPSPTSGGGGSGQDLTKSRAQWSELKVMAPSGVAEQRKDSSSGHSAGEALVPPAKASHKASVRLV